MCKDVIILGMSGHASVISEIISLNGDRVFGFLDDDVSKEGTLGTVDKCNEFIDKYFIIGIGNNAIRQKIAEKYPHLNYYTALHPRAIISKSARVGSGSVVMANAVINTNATIGNHCIINTSSVVEHDCTVGDFSHISPSATLCGTVNVGQSSHIGAGAVVKNNTNICDSVTVGAGGVVVEDILLDGVYVGIPARKIK